MARTELIVLGAGCTKCDQLAANVETAANSLGIEYTLEKVGQIDRILSYGVILTPALVVDGRVMAVGKVLGVEAIKEMLAG